MARYAIDAVTLVRLVTDDVPRRAEHQLVAPSAIRTDALSLLYAAVRRGEIAERAALDLHERMTSIKMRVLGDRVSRRTAWTLASEEYLAVCVLQADALVTVDPVMIARATGIVPLVPLSALTEP